MDWSDDITYAVHDLEDFVRCDRVPMASIVSDAREFEWFYVGSIGRVMDKIGQSSVNWQAFKASFQALLQAIFPDFSASIDNYHRRGKINEACSFLIERYVHSVDYAGPNMPIWISPDVRAEVELLKQLTWRYVIDHPDLVTAQQGQRRLVRKLYKDLRYLLDEAVAGKAEHKMPPRLRQFHDICALNKYSDFDGDDHAGRARAVCDYMAALTEPQVKELAARLRGGDRDGMSDSWIGY